MSNEQNESPEYADDSPQNPLYQCPNCGVLVRYGELICFNCGVTLVGSGTRALEQPEETFEAMRGKSIGKAIGHPHGITLVIQGQQLPLPAGSRLIVGRFDVTSTAPPPDVDLGKFGADTLGVSRQHLELDWRNGLIYVTDLGSTNGTLLNGQRLVAGIERVLRDNDDLTFGQLKTLVRFVRG